MLSLCAQAALVFEAVTSKSAIVSPSSTLAGVLASTSSFKEAVDQLQHPALPHLLGVGALAVLGRHSGGLDDLEAWKAHAVASRHLLQAHST